MRFLVLGAVLALGGCASDTLDYVFSGAAPEAFTAPDGRQGYALSCRSGMATCMEDARTACGGNFDVLDQRERTTYTPPDKIAKMEARTGVARSMEVACKP